MIVLWRWYNGNCFYLIWECTFDSYVFRLVRTLALVTYHTHTATFKNIPTLNTNLVRLGWFNINMPSCQYVEEVPLWRDMKILRSHYLYKGIFYTAKTTHLQWLLTRLEVYVSFVVAVVVFIAILHVYTMKFSTSYTLQNHRSVKLQRDTGNHRIFMRPLALEQYVSIKKKINGKCKHSRFKIHSCIEL